MDFNSYRFPLSDLTLKPGKIAGQSALCLVYADSRAYQEALDAAQVDWQTRITAVNDKAVVVALTINGVTRSATGEDTDLMSAEARAFKRACSAFGLGRYLYSIDLGFQPFDGKHFAQPAYTALQRALQRMDAPCGVWAAWQRPEDAYAWAVEAGAATCTKHARNAFKKLVDEQFAGALTTGNWPTVAQAFYSERTQRKEEKQAVAA